MIYEFEISNIKIVGEKFYECIEYDSREEAELIINQKFAKIDVSIILNRTFTDDRFMRAVKKAELSQKDLLELLNEGDLDAFVDNLDKDRDRHFIFVDYDKKIVKVWPTLDPTFLPERFRMNNPR